MIKLYIADVSGIDILSALGRVSEHRRGKVMRLPTDEKKRQSLGAELLLYKALGGKAEYSVDENGKPYIENGAHFSLSHCGNYAVCAVSDSVCGVDIEKLRDGSIKLAKRFFTEAEYNRIAASSDPDELFCEYWVMKESYLKTVGTGLKTALSSFEAGDKIGGFYLKHLNFKGYHIAVCSAESVEKLIINEEKL